MKTLLMTLCIGLACGGAATAQEQGEPDPTPTKDTVGPANEQQTELISSEEVLSSIEENGLDFSQTIYSEEAFSTLNIDTNNTVEKVTTNELTRIELQRVQITGTVTPVVKKRTFGSFLQLFNPFASAEYGGTGEPIGKAPSRAFMDPVVDQPASPLIAVGGKPKKSDK